MGGIKIEYYGDCHHIFSDDIQSSDCIKRYFTIMPLRGEEKRIAICNEYLRLKVRENQYKWTGYRSYNPYQYTVEDIVNEYVLVSHYSYYEKQQNRINPEFDYCVCQRPFITSRISLFKAIEILKEAQETFTLSDYNEHFIERTYTHIHEVAHYLSKYNKYKRQKERIDILLKYLKPHIHDTKNSQRLMELVLIFFEIQTYIESCKK